MSLAQRVALNRVMPQSDQPSSSSSKGGAAQGDGNRGMGMSARDSFQFNEATALQYQEWKVSMQYAVGSRQITATFLPF